MDEVLVHLEELGEIYIYTHTLHTYKMDIGVATRNLKIFLYGLTGSRLGCFHYSGILFLKVEGIRQSGAKQFFMSRRYCQQE